METPVPPAEPDPGPMASRQLGLWLLAAVAATALLVLVLRQYAPTQFASFGPGDAQKGQELFQSKGCAHCHSVSGAGSRVGPDLTGRSLTGPDRLLTQMWNHAPQMLEQAQSRGVAYPSLTREEVAHMSAYLSAEGKKP